MNVLVSYHTDPQYMSPVQFSENQVCCGPFYEDVSKDGRILSKKTPVGYYDIKEIVDTLPDSQKPDLLIVKSDATRNNFPVNIGSLGIPSVLIIGDTQHQLDPLQTMIKYAASEPYTVFVADHVRRHLHYFIEAGLKNVFWAPAINLRDWNIDFQNNRNYPVTFIGQTGKFHPYRKNILDRLKTNSEIALVSGTAPQEEASEVYSKSLVSLNLSMNGDVNLRVFEILAAGGFLLTDRLTKYAGLEILFDEGVHLDCFESYEELEEKILFYSKNPQSVFDLAMRGYQEYLRSHKPRRKHKQLLDLATKGWADSTWNAERDLRSIFCKSDDFDTFFNRIRVYECFQEKQLKGANQKLLFLPSSNPYLVSDCCDLYRTEITCMSNSHEKFFRMVDCLDNIILVDEIDLKEKFHSLVCGCNGVLDESFFNTLKLINTHSIVVDDYSLKTDELKSAVQKYLEKNGFVKGNTDGEFHRMNSV